MFWDKGYAPSQNIEALLEKENATVEEFLDDDDILQECKSQKKAIVNYFTRPDVLKRLVELITTEPSDDVPMVQRFRYANMACEILTLGLPSLNEKLLSDESTLNKLYSYLENKPPLNPLLSSFFNKTFSMLFTKKAEQDWFLYQQTCLQLLEYIKSQNNFLELICMHFSTPIIPDLVLQMMKKVEGGQLKRNLYKWLTEDKLVDRLIALLGNPQEVESHANVAAFLCDLIQQGRAMRQTDEENDSFEPAFPGSNPILKAIEDEATINALLNVILEPNAQETVIVSGILVVLTLIRPIVFVEEPDTTRMEFIHNREREIHEQVLITVIRAISPRLKDFNELLKNPPNKPEIITTAAKLSPPFGMTRLQICHLFTVLLQTTNEEISNAICKTDFFETLLALFKQYCWNNFLHSQVEKCLQLIFNTPESSINSTQGNIIVNDVTFTKSFASVENKKSFMGIVFKQESSAGDNIDNAAGDGGSLNKNHTLNDGMNKVDLSGDVEMSEKATDNIINAVDEEENASPEENDRKSANEMETDDASTKKLQENSNEAFNSGDNEADQEGACGGARAVKQDTNNTTKVETDICPSLLQTHLIVHCKLVSKLIDCWQYNKEMESAERGRRLGYMGHLITILKHITNCISKSEHIGALIESNLSNASELELWQSIINPNNGDFTKALATQNKKLANCNAYEAGDYSQPLPKEFLSDNSTLDYFMSIDVMNNLSPFGESGGNFGPTIDPDEDEEDDENTGSGDGGGRLRFDKSASSTSALQTFGVPNNPWDNMDPFSEMAATSSTNSNTTPWAADFGSDNFADFDAHFSSFTNDLGESLVVAASIKEKNNLLENKFEIGNGDCNVRTETNPEKTKSETDTCITERIIPPLATIATTAYDNNANVEKTVTMLETQEIGKFADDDTDTDIDAFADAESVRKSKALAASLVLSLQSVMQEDSEDDYEDDEGMWTKPLGDSAVEIKQYNDVNEVITEKDNDYDGSDEKVLNAVRGAYTNGPRSKTELTETTESIQQLNVTNTGVDEASKSTMMEHGNDTVAIGVNIKRTNSATPLDGIADMACNATVAAMVSPTAATTNAVEISTSNEA